MLASNFIDDYFKRIIDLNCLNYSIRHCRRCPALNLEDTRSAPGYGTPMSPIMLLGQSLCKACMKTQITFTKGSGYLIDRALAEICCYRWDIFITNVVHCHPLGNRSSTEEEVENCLQYLIAEINIVQPQLIICMGNDAANTISRLAGEVVENVTRKMMVDEHSCGVVKMFHPAYAMRGGCDANKWVEDLAKWMEPYMSDFPIEKEKH